MSVALDDDISSSVYDRQVVTRILRYLRPHLKLVLFSLSMMLLYTLTAVATPWLISKIINSFIMTNDLSGLNIIIAFFFGAVALNYIGMYLYSRSMGKISEEILYKLRVDMFDHVQRLSIPFFDRNDVGRVMSRVQNDVHRLQDFLPMLIHVFSDLLSLGGIILAMVLMNYKLALITLAVIPFLFIIVAVWRPHVRRSYLRVRSAMAAVNSSLQQNISGVRVVQSMNRENVNINRFDQLNQGHLDASLRAARLSGYITPAVELLTAAGLALIVIVGGNMVLNGDMEVGYLVAFALYIQRFFDPIRSLTHMYSGFQRAMTSGSRIFELMDIEPEVADKLNAMNLPNIKGEVRYENISFHYIEGRPVLNKIDLHIKAGQKVALVGQTGAGKTSMVSLLARFYDVTDGRITVDGNDLRDITRSSLASQMSMVLQEPFLFSISVSDNIRYRNHKATDVEIISVAKAVGAHDFITQLPQGYNTILAERGGNLSMGQRQLISFARAVLVNPRILILDEATANIDTFTEIVIQKALDKMLQGRTSIIIAHRLSTIQSSDMIVVMENGCIIDKGTHPELLERCNAYKRMYMLNFVDEQD